VTSDRARRRRRGFQKERELVRKLWQLGFATMRAPASGSKAKKTYQPDIIAVRNNKIFVIEVKTRKTKSTIYVDRYQVEKVKEWVKRAGTNAYGLIGVYVGREYGWRFIPIERTQQTRSGNTKVDLEQISRAFTLDDLKHLTDENVRKIDTFLDKNSL
jgi:Holliday junction resolvase